MTEKKKKDTNTESIEQQLERLEGLVAKLEGGEVALEESLKLFEEGVELYRACKKKMGAIEIKISKLTESMREEPIDE